MLEQVPYNEVLTPGGTGRVHIYGSRTLVVEVNGSAQNLKYHWSGELVFDDDSILLPYAMRFHYVINNASWDAGTLLLKKQLTVTAEPVV